jgi:hypothetical protein
MRSGSFPFLGSRTAHTGIPNATSAKKPAMPAAITPGWRGPGQAVTVAGLTISGGLVYIGPEGGRSDGRGASAIDPSLAVAASSASAPPLGYWPSYAGISPEGRRRYLEWLSSGSQDPGADIGYVFLYFYGLERRLILESPGHEEMRALLTELHRLRSVYAGNHSFDGYSRCLVDVTSYLLDPAGAIAAAAELTARPGERPLAVTVAIAKQVASGRPLGCDLACAALFGLPEFASDLRSVKDAGLSTLKGLLTTRFSSTFPDGYRAYARKDSHFCLYYRGAASGLQAELTGRAGLQGLPDPATLAWTKLLAFGTAAACDVAPYAKALRYHPVMADSLAGIRLSPVELRDQVAIEARGWLGGLPVPLAAVPFGELARHAIGKSSARWSMRDHQQVVDALAAVSFGMEPDPAEGKEHLEDGSIVQVFHVAGDTRSRAMIVAFAAAALVLAVARTADGKDVAVAQHWLAAVPSRLRLTAGQLVRLRAQLAWRATNRLTVPRAMRMLGDATLEEREFCAWSATEAAIATGQLDKPQIAVLEHIYDLLGIAHSRLYAGLHADIGAAVTDADEPVLVSSAIAEALHSIARPPVMRPIGPDPEEPAKAAADTQARLARIRADTDSVSALLAEIFVEDEALGQRLDDVDSGRFTGLDVDHAALLDRLLHRLSWPRAEFDTAASAAGLMPGGAMETINEWSFDHFGEALIEDADPVVINEALLPQAAEAVPAE